MAGDLEPPSSATPSPHPRAARGFWTSWLGFFINNKLVVVVMTLLLVFAGLSAAPFRWDLGSLPRSPVPVDAIPDIGENQQIVFTEWPGRSPRDVEDQVTYPLTTALLGIPGVRTVRSFSMFGFSTIYVIFDDGVEFYWSRSRVLEKLAALPANTLPDNVAPSLGPDATALGQVFWYTLEGRSPDGRAVTGGWDPYELRTIQDWTVRFALQSVPGVSEVASVGGHVKEYQVDVDSEAMRANRVSIDQVANAVRQANLDVGARTLEINKAEYVVRGVGFVQDARDLEEVVVRNVEHTPIRLRDVARVKLGPALRRGALDKGGAPAVGGVAVVRFGANPMEVIERLKAKVAEISPGLPVRTLEDGTRSKVTIVPFYDRTQLIKETLGTLSTALSQEILVTVLVVLVMLRNLRSSLIISSVLPLGVLGAFVLMRYFGVDANVMALSGIAIAIGTMVDMGIVLVENIVEHLERAGPRANRRRVVRDAAAEVAPAVVTSTLTTVVGFLPIFALTASEGKLFTPLAFTKTFAMVTALLLALTVLPVVAHLVLRRPPPVPQASPRSARALAGAMFSRRRWIDWALVAFGLVTLRFNVGLGLLIAFVALMGIVQGVLPRPWPVLARGCALGAALVFVVVLLADDWLPLGAGSGWWNNRIFVGSLIAALMLAILAFVYVYPSVLRLALGYKIVTLGIPALLLVGGLTVWLGFGTTFQWLPDSARTSRVGTKLRHAFPGLGREFMPAFDEGSFLYMPTTMPHASMAVTLDQLSKMDASIQSVPEVETAVGKLGRAESPLDPAPISMYEVVVNYRPEYKVDEDGRRLTFAFDESTQTFVRDDAGNLVDDPDGRPFRQWRPHIKGPNDIWAEIQEAASMPGLTSAPELMPIAARIVMLQSGMRAPMGMKIRGPNLHTLERVAIEMEGLLRQVPGVRPETVVADRIVGKPYLEIVINRTEIARHGISMQKVQEVIQMGIGGATVTRTVEGRERYSVRVRYMREDRSNIEQLKRVLVPSPLGHQIPLEQLAEVRYVRGPQVIKSEDTFLTAYVVFDKVSDRDEVGVVEGAKAFLQQKLDSRELKLPDGVSYTFAGSYENQLRSQKTLSVLVPTALALIFLLIYLQFRRVATTLGIFCGVAVAMSGGFLLIWLYGQPWFLDAAPFGVDLRTLFQVHPVNLSVAVWVGFIALLGIATDDGVVMSTYLHQKFRGAEPPVTVDEVRRRTIEAAQRRIRPCMMTTATTLLALLPVVTSTGRGSDVMVPMTLPLLGGMGIEILTLFVVPVLHCWGEERRLAARRRRSVPTSHVAVPPSQAASGA